MCSRLAPSSALISLVPQKYANAILILGMKDKRLSVDIPVTVIFRVLTITLLRPPLGGVTHQFHPEGNYVICESKY